MAGTTVKSKTIANNKRKPAKVSRSMVAPIAVTEPLLIKDMLLIADGGWTARFERLTFKGCPTFNCKNEKYSHIEYIDMKRDAFVREVYRLFQPKFNISSNTRFKAICKYITWLDEQELTCIDNDYFHNELIKRYMMQWGEWIQAGRYKKNTWCSARSVLAWILKELERYSDVNLLPNIKGQSKSTESYTGYDLETELKPTVKALFRGYIELEKHLKSNTTPTFNPIYNEQLFKKHCLKKELNNVAKAARLRAFKVSIIGRGDWRNQMSRIATMLCFMFTGMNYTTMLKMQRKDVEFKQVHGGKYIFTSNKSRAKELELDNAFGFGRYAKEFIESWLLMSSLITGDNENAPLFPYICMDGTIKTFFSAAQSPHQRLNKLLGYMGLSNLTASRLRQTKVDTLMKVTEDIFLVSLSANNSVNSIKRHYSSGNEKDHVRNISSAMTAQFNIAKGADLIEAVNNAKYTFHDILSDYDYRKLRKDTSTNKESITPIGVRCEDNTKGTAHLISKALKRSGIEMDSNEEICTDFLGCFECDEHKLVAAIDDIWLMLSFKDTLDEMKQYPAVNSLPQSKFKKLCNTIAAILERFREVSVDNYKHATERHKKESHPLYQNLYSLNDLLEVFS